MSTRPRTTRRHGFALAVLLLAVLIALVSVDRGTSGDRTSTPEPDVVTEGFDPSEPPPDTSASYGFVAAVRAPGQPLRRVPAGDRSDLTTVDGLVEVLSSRPGIGPILSQSLLALRYLDGTVVVIRSLGAPAGATTLRELADRLVDTGPGQPQVVPSGGAKSR